MKISKGLLIEDDRDDFELITYALRRDSALGVEVIWRTSFNDVEERPVFDHFDFVLLDLSLGETYGVNTFNRAKELFGEIPIIILTDLQSIIFAKKLMGLGARGYIFKSEIIQPTFVKNILLLLR